MIASRKTVLWFLGGAALLTGLYLTLDKLKDTLEAQLADRLTQAVDQLRDGNLEVRLGGIYALEGLARTSESEYWPIMEILTTFVRERASVTKNQPPPEPPLRLAPDIQAALDVIGRRRHTFRDGESQRLDLRGTDLRRANLAGAELQGADLTDANGLVWEQLKMAKKDNKTRLPAYLSLRARWILDPLIGLLYHTFELAIHALFHRLHRVHRVRATQARGHVGRDRGTPRAVV